MTFKKFLWFSLFLMEFNSAELPKLPNFCFFASLKSHFSEKKTGYKYSIMVWIVNFLLLRNSLVTNYLALSSSNPKFGWPKSLNRGNCKPFLLKQRNNFFSKVLDSFHQSTSQLIKFYLYKFMPKKVYWDNILSFEILLNESVKSSKAKKAFVLPTFIMTFSENSG